MNILVIGGTRFMGPHVVGRLAAHGHSVTVFNRGRTPAVLPKGVRHLIGDRDDIEAHRKELLDFHPEVVIDMMLLNEKQAAELVRLFGGMARKIVVASSGDVYLRYDQLRGREPGEGDKTPVTEESSLRHVYYPYRETASGEGDRMYWYDKILAERTVLTCPDLSAVILRLPMVYGPEDYQHRWRRYVRRMRDKRRVILLGEAEAAGRMTRAYSENCAAAIVLAAEHDQSGDRVYNVGDHDTPDELTWVSLIAESMDWDGRVATMPDKDLPPHLQSGVDWRFQFEIDTSRIRSELGFVESVNRQEALRRTIAWEMEVLKTEPCPEDEYQAEDTVLARRSQGR